MCRGFWSKMNWNRGVQISLEILDYQLNILHNRFYQINGCYSMQLFSELLDIKVKGNVILSEIFHFKQRGNNIVIWLIEDYYFPSMILLVKYLLKELLLLLYEICSCLEGGKHIYVRKLYYWLVIKVFI